MFSNHSRRQHLHGALSGAAIGDALGHPRCGLSRSAALGTYGPAKLAYQSALGGVYSCDTHLMLMIAQATLNSRSDTRGFRRAFRWRLSMYPLSGPKCHWFMLRPAARSWLARFGVTSGVAVDNNVVAATVVFETLAVHGSGHRTERWAEDTAKLISIDPQVLDCAKMLSRAIAYAALLKEEEFSAEKALQAAADGCATGELKDKVERLGEFLRSNTSPADVADEFGWSKGISSAMLPLAVMSLYCWLRSPDNFEGAVLPAIDLGGDTASLGATTGALVGGCKGIDAIPEKLREKLGGTPHNSDWIEKMAARLSHWPHGEHDLHAAPAQPSDPLMQIIRNKFVWLRYAIARVGRMPRRLGGRSRSAS